MQGRGASLQKKQVCWNLPLKQSVKSFVYSSTKSFIKLNTLLMWGYAPHPRTSFLFTKKGCKDVSKRTLPLWNLLGGKFPPQWSKDHAPPRLSQNFQQERGERDRLRLLREGMVLVGKANWFCFPSLGKSNFIRFSWWRRIILICAACFNRHLAPGDI